MGDGGPDIAGHDRRSRAVRGRPPGQRCRPPPGAGCATIRGMALVESVPNVSEGRRLEVVDRLAAALESVPGAHLLDRTQRPVPQPERVHARRRGRRGRRRAGAARRAALREIDMEEQSGEHPRIGAVDVVRSCPSATRRWTSASVSPATSAADREPLRPPRLPLRGRGARPDRVKLADVRRGQYEGLRDEIATRGREPDFGPARMHPRGGATCVGARPFLIAWNINLASDDVELAKRIAHRVRESSGGLPRSRRRASSSRSPGAPRCR